MKFVARYGPIFLAISVILAVSILPYWSASGDPHTLLAEHPEATDSASAAAEERAIAATHSAPAATSSADTAHADSSEESLPVARPEHTERASAPGTAEIVDLTRDLERTQTAFGKAFASMKAKDAAQILAHLSDATARGVLAGLPPRTAAAILAEVEPERAARLASPYLPTLEPR